MKIIFTNVHGASEEYAPQPAYQLVPDWYKKTESYINGKKVPVGNGGTASSVKRCMPVFDAINSGYLLVTHTDLWIKHLPPDPEKPDKTLPWFEWALHDAIHFHPPEQAPLHPAADGNSMPKWINPWGIKTPKGYSSLFVTPMHRDNPFIALPGVVDTDMYTAPVNIIFTLANPKFEGLVPAGTPICQVIPFKRDEWKMEFGGQEDYNDQHRITVKLKSKFFDGYKSLFRQPKEYR